MKQLYRARFHALTLVQVVLLIASISLLSWSLVATDFLALPVVVASAVLLQVLALLHYVESHVSTLEDFFATISYEDFTRRYVEDDVDVELKEAFNRILGKFQDARAER